MSSAEFSEWGAYFKIDAAEMKRIRDGGSSDGSTRVTTMARPGGVEVV